MEKRNYPNEERKNIDHTELKNFISLILQVNIEFEDIIRAFSIDYQGYRTSNLELRCIKKDKALVVKENFINEHTQNSGQLIHIV